jgi:replicative DNA helicase
MNNLYDEIIERNVIARIIVDNNDLLLLIDKIKADYFFIEIHKEIIEAIKHLYKNDVEIDIVSIYKYFKDKDKSSYGSIIAEIAEYNTASLNIEHNFNVIKELYFRRNFLMTVTKLQTMASDMSITYDELFDKTVTLSDRLIEVGEDNNRIKNFNENVADYLERLNTIQTLTKEGKLISPSLLSIKKYIPSYNGGDLIIIAGRPSMGKTAFAIHEAKELSKKGYKILFFSLEMPRHQLVERILISELGNKYFILKKDSLTSQDWGDIDDAANKIIHHKIFIDDKSLSTYEHIKSVSKIMDKRHGIDAIFIDYLQLMGTDKRLPREQQISTISRHLKALAKDIDCPIFLLSQLNREAERRPDHKPMMSDLRESGAIEQDADIVLFPFRPEYYNKEDESLKGIGEIIISKNRNNKRGSAFVRYNETVTQFYDMEEKPF